MPAIRWTIALLGALLAASAHAGETPQEQANKQAVLEFYEKALNEKDFEAASRYLGNRYTQHNPTAADGPEGLKAFLAFLRDKFPKSHSEVKRAFADGNYVILHVNAVREPGTRGRAIVDIFKLEDGKIVEHWDVAQDVPEKAANNNGMFHEGPQTGMPPELAAKVAALGRVIDPPKTIPLYAPLQEKEPYKGVKVARDVRYGPDARNLLDVFTAPEVVGARPVLVYVHGGGFVAGNKLTPGTPFYDNINLWAVRHGIVGVNMTYRLAPAAKWPAGAQDVGRAVAWVRENIAAYGGNPARIYLMGNSAGATHVADYVAQVAEGKLPGPPVAGAILLSGVYDLTAFDPKPLSVYFGNNLEAYAERSPIRGLLMSRVPLIVSTAELDPEPFERQARELRDALCTSARGCQRFLVLAKHNHLTQVQSINTADTTLTRPLLEFIR